MNSMGSSSQSLHLRNSYEDRRVSYMGHGRLENVPFGSDVRNIQVRINYEMGDGRLVAASGETSATTQKRPETKQKYQSLEPYSDGKSFKDIFSNSAKEVGRKTDGENQNDPVKINEREKKEELKSKIKELDVKLESEKSKENSNVSSPFVHKEFNTSEIASKKSGLEEEVRLLKMNEELKLTFAILTDIRKRMVSNIFEMMSFGIDSQPGRLLNTLI